MKQQRMNEGPSYAKAMEDVQRMGKRIEQKETERKGEKEERILTQSRKVAKGGRGRPCRDFAGRRMGNDSAGFNFLLS